MDEITLLRAIRPGAADFSDGERGEVLCRLLAAAAGERSRGQAGRSRPGLTRRPWRRWATPGLARGAAVAAALAIAAAGLTALALPLSGSGSASAGRGARPGQPGPSSVTQLLSGAGDTGPTPTPASFPPEQGAPASAAALLQRAAQAAAATPDVTLQPDQFVFTEEFHVGGLEGVGQKNGQVNLVSVPPYIDRTWLSADGTRGMADQRLGLPGTHWGPVSALESLCEGAENDPSRQVCYGGYLGSLPDTVPGMLSYLLQSGGPNGPTLYKAMTGFGNVSWLSDQFASSSSFALMYEALATVPGLSLVAHVTDAAGRAGIAVAACEPVAIDKGSMPNFHGCPVRYELIFNAQTYELIGADSVSAKGIPPYGGDTALLGMAVVSKIGQLP